MPSYSGLESRSIKDDLRVAGWTGVRIAEHTPCGSTTSGLKDESSGDTTSLKELIRSSSAGFLSVNADSLSSDLLSLPMRLRHVKLPKGCDIWLVRNAGRVIVRVFFASKCDEASGLRARFSARSPVSTGREIGQGDSTTTTSCDTGCSRMSLRD